MLEDVSVTVEIEYSALEFVDVHIGQVIFRKVLDDWNCCMNEELFHVGQL